MLHWVGLIPFRKRSVKTKICRVKRRLRRAGNFLLKLKAVVDKLKMKRLPVKKEGYQGLCLLSQQLVGQERGK